MQKRRPGAKRRTVGLVPQPGSQMLLKDFKNSLTSTSQKSRETFENSYHAQFKRSSFIVGVILALSTNPEFYGT